MRKIIISNKAKEDTLLIFEYLEKKWSERIRRNFAIKLYNCIKTIRDNPEAFPKSNDKKTLYKCVITKQTTLFYKFTSLEINIVAVFDTRQNPTKIKNTK